MVSKDRAGHSLLLSTGVLLFSTVLLLLAFNTGLSAPKTGGDAPDIDWPPEDNVEDQYCENYYEHPLWAHDVEFSLVQGSEKSFVQGPTAFVQPGDVINVSFIVENRVPSECGIAYMAKHSRQSDDVEARRWLDWDKEWNAPSSFPCLPGSLSDSSGHCILNDTIQVPSGRQGEARMRYVFFDESPTRKLLLGVERVIVIDQRPDLVPLELIPRDEQDSLHTLYETSGMFEARVGVGNGGSYPDWSPNRGPAYARSSFDGSDSDLGPDELEKAKALGKTNQREWSPDPYASPYGIVPTCMGQDGQENTEPWNDLSEESGTNDTLVCSYKRGRPMSLGFHFETWSVYNESRPVEEQETEPSDARDYQGKDKDDVIPPGGDAWFEVEPFSREDRAGPQRVEAAVGGTESGVSHGDNGLEGELIVPGADLEVSSFEVEATDPNGPCGERRATACPPAASLHLSTHYRNNGTPGMDESSSLDRLWRAALYADGEEVEAGPGGPDPSPTIDGIPNTTDGEIPLWPSPVKLDPPSDGGRLELKVHLDDPDTYENDVGPNGRVSEIQETEGCPKAAGAADNVACQVVFIEDGQAPEIDSVSIRGSPQGEAKEVFQEGEEVTLQARVSDGSLTAVNATLTFPNDTIETIPLTPESPHSGSWSVTKKMVGVVGQVNVGLHARDGFGHATRETDLESFTIEELPKEIRIPQFDLNGKTGAEAEEEARYRGSADDGDNWFRVEMEFNETGRADPYDPTNRTLEVHDPDGRERYELPLGVYTACTLRNEATGEVMGQAEGDRCKTDEHGPLVNVTDRRPRFFVDTRCSPGQDPEPHAKDCRDVDPDLREAWQQPEMTWIGRFNLTSVVEGGFDRLNRSNVTVNLTDVDGPPRVEDPVISTETLEPGALAVLAVNVSDALRVEDVSARIEKPGGQTHPVNLTLVKATDAADGTENGTYAQVVQAGSGHALDQAGTYNVEFAAEDFAGKVQRLSGPQLTVEDEQPPKIQAFRPIGGDRHEVDAPIQWKASIQDETALNRPHLNLTLPDGSQQTVPLSRESASDSFVSDPVRLASGVTGTIEAKLVAMDFAGGASSKTLEVQVLENLPPRTALQEPSGLSPDGKHWIAPNGTVVVDVYDYGAGVKRSSLVMKLNGDRVNAEIEEITHGYRLRHSINGTGTPYHRKPITVQIAAADLTEPHPQRTFTRTHALRLDVSPPHADVSFDPVVRDGDRVIVGPQSITNTTVTDWGAGPQAVHVGLTPAPESPGRPVDAELTPNASVGVTDLLPVPGAIEKTYNLKIRGEDAVGNRRLTVNQTLILDAKPPSIEIVPEPGAPPERVTARITDTSGVQGAEIRYSVDGAPMSPISMNRTGDEWVASLPPQPEGRIVNFTVHARDALGNGGYRPPIEYTTGDESPGIEIETPRGGSAVSGSTQVSWRSEDLDDPAGNLTVMLAYRPPEGSFEKIPGATGLPANGSFEFNASGLPNGVGILQAIVTDGATFASDEIEIELRDLDPPFEAVELGPDNSTPGTVVTARGQTLRIEVSLTRAADEVTAKLSGPHDLLDTVELRRSGAQTWTGLLAVPSDEGTYDVSLTADTGDGTVTSENVYSIQVQDRSTWTDAMSSGPALVSILATVTIGWALSRRWKD